MSVIRGKCDARPVTFLATGHQHLFTGTNLYILVTGCYLKAVWAKLCQSWVQCSNH